MKKIYLWLLIAFITHTLACCQTPEKPDAIDKKIDTLLAKMTLEEKIGQMNQYSGFWDATGPAPSEGDAKNKYDHLKKGWVGSVLNVSGVENVREMQKMAVEESRLGIPLIFGLDVVHGFKTLSPIPLAESASWDLEAIKKSAQMAAAEATAAGINWTFAPMVDIYRDARWGRVMEGAGEDPYLGAQIAIARVQGFQGDDLAAINTMAACAKHFAGYGFVESGRDYNTVDIGTSTLYNMILPPFKAAAEADVKTFMNSFNIINGVPATGNSLLQRDILKGEWNYQGFVVSDWGSCGEMVNHGYAADLKEAAELAANAGSDMDMESYAYIKYLAQLVNEGKVKESLIDDAVRRILRVKFELGLFDDPYKYCDAKRYSEELYSDAHMEAALDMARKSIVLLKNDNALLPLNKKQKNIAIIGALADDKTSPLGSWRVSSDDNTAISVLEGVKKYTSDFKYRKGVDLLSNTDIGFQKEMELNVNDRSGFNDAIALAKKSEVVIMVLGEHGLQSGEGRSRAHLGLPGLQQELLEKVYLANPNIILVLMNGRPLTIPWADAHIPAIVEAWQLGTQSGNAIADILFGAYNPSGKLPMTFPRSVGQCPIYYNHFSTGRPNNSGTVFWSHYTDESNKPLYPFGYGLSYTEFSYANLMVDDSNPKHIKVSVNVTNTGNYSGTEIAQLYICDKAAQVVRPVKELKGFQKVTLQPTESRTITFELTDKELGYYNGQGVFMVDPGEFEIMVGTNSNDVLKSTITL